MAAFCQLCLIINEDTIQYNTIMEQGPLNIEEFFNRTMDPGISSPTDGSHGGLRTSLTDQVGGTYRKQRRREQKRTRKREDMSKRRREQQTKRTIEVEN